MSKAKPEDFPPTEYNEEELRQLLDEVWRRLAQLKRVQREQFLRMLVAWLRG
jgi:hypothetical protein